jgi:hypothetical protein
LAGFEPKRKGDGDAGKYLQTAGVVCISRRSVSGTASSCRAYLAFSLVGQRTRRISEGGRMVGFRDELVGGRRRQLLHIITHSTGMGDHTSRAHAGVWASVAVTSLSTLQWRIAPALSARYSRVLPCDWMGGPRDFQVRLGCDSEVRLRSRLRCPQPRSAVCEKSG